MTAILLLVVATVALGGALAYVWFNRSAQGSTPTSRTASIDPFTLQDPWRRHVQNALGARAKVERAIDQRQDGPTRDRLRDLINEIDDVVARIWEVASEGHQLATAGRLTDLPSLERRLNAAEDATASAPVDTGEPSLESMSALASARAAVESARRIATMRDSSDANLRSLSERLNELVVRAIEVSAVQITPADADSLRADLDSMIVDLEGLRLGLQETRQIAQA